MIRVNFNLGYSLFNLQFYTKNSLKLAIIYFLYISLFVAESRPIEYDATDRTQDEIHRQLGYMPDGRIPDIGAVKETTRLDRDNMDYKRPVKEGRAHK